MLARKVYRAMSYNRPVTIRPELGEKAPCHADMLRYDTAFCNPNDPSQVVFPIFKDKKHGRMSSNITLGRWESFSIRLDEVQDEKVTLSDVGEWETYIHPDGNYGLEKRTLNQFLMEHPALTVVGWR